MADSKSIHIPLEIWGALFCFAAAVCICLSRNKDKRQMLTLGIMQVANCLLLICDTLAWAFRGSATAAGYYWVRISNFSVFAMSYVGIALFMLFLYYSVSEQCRSKMKPGMIACFSVCITAVISLVVSQFTDFYYYFDEENYYHRNNKYYFIIMLLAAVALVIIFVMSIVFRKEMKKIYFRCAMVYFALPVVAMVFQLLFYGISILNLGITIASLIIFMLYEMELSRENVRQERRLRALETEVYAAQLKPHFIFNMLSTIKFLYAEYPEKADESVDELATYFRNYINCLDTEKLIPFGEEISNIQSFVKLEKLRFDNRLKAEFDIQSENFSVPPFILQPIVENAVKHGVTKRPDGGTVKISSRETTDGWKIVVEDDGVGFDLSESKADGRKHVGIENVRQRLELSLGGTLEIESEKNVGTRVFIFIPKEAISEHLSRRR